MVDAIKLISNITKYQMCISTGAYHTVGLKTDSSVVATGYNKYGQRNVHDWNGVGSVDKNRALEEPVSKQIDSQQTSNTVPVQDFYYCRNCGQKLHITANFCTRCGNPQHRNQTQTTTTSNTQQLSTSKVSTTTEKDIKNTSFTDIVKNKKDSSKQINDIKGNTNNSSTYNGLSLESLNSPVFEWSGSEYIGTNQERVRKIRKESNNAIAWFNAQNFIPIPTGLGLDIEAGYCYDMALQAQDAGNVQEAWAGFYQALQRYCRLNDRKKIGLTCFNLGKVYGVRKNWELAMLMFLHSAYITKNLGEQKGFAWSVFYLGDVVSNLGDKDTAKLFITEVLPVFRQVLPENVAGVEAYIRRLAN